MEPEVCLPPIYSAAAMAKIQCEQCDKTYNRPSLLAQHMRTHTGERPFKCTECDSSFTRKAHLDSHLRSHTSERAFVCTHCGKGVHTKQHLERHMNMHRKDHQCNECGESFRMAIQLRRHVLGHSLKCLCGQSFRTPSMLARHKREDKEYKCPHCEETAACPTLLLIHQREHREQREKEKVDKAKNKKIQLPLPPELPKSSVEIDPNLLLPPNKRKRPRATGKTTIGLLTGSHYAKRAIPCPVKDCVHRANRKYDMARHIAASHPDQVLEDLSDGEDSDDAVRVAAEASQAQDPSQETPSASAEASEAPETTPEATQKDTPPVSTTV